MKHNFVRQGGEDRFSGISSGPGVEARHSANRREEQRTITQVCEMLLNEGVEAYKKEGPKFMQRLVAKQKARVKGS